LRRIDRDAHRGGARAVDPARQIDRIDAGCRVHRLDHCPRQTFDWAVEAGAEQGIDDNIRRHQRCRLGG